VSIDPVLSAGVRAVGFCHVADQVGNDEETVHRINAISIMAGPIVTAAVREGLGLDEYFWGTESLSVRDAEGIDAAIAALPEGGPDFETLCQQRAIRVVMDWRPVYAAVVAALLEHTTLDAEAFAAVVAPFPL
jgi:hypothetical protein